MCLYLGTVKPASYHVKDIDISRPETEAYTTYLGKLVLEQRLPGIEYEKHTKEPLVDGHRPLKILDICSGSGCISLLLQSMLQESFSIQVVGLDISETAIKLANENVKLLRPFPTDTTQPSYQKVDIFQPLEGDYETDIVITNPPYISARSFNTDVSRSVRIWEPKLALVPPVVPGAKTVDHLLFYRRILQLNKDRFKSKILVMEVEDQRQAEDVVRIACEILGNINDRVEIWRDFPASEVSIRCHSRVPNSAQDKITTRNIHFTVRGLGHWRSVVIYGSNISTSGASRMTKVRFGPST